MKEKSFSISDAINFGWNTFKKWPFTFLALLFIPTLLQYAVQFGGGIIIGILNIVLGIKDSDSVLSVLLTVVVMILSIGVGVIVHAGVLRLQLDAVEGKKPELNELFAHKDRAVAFFIAGLIVAVGAFFGIILFVIPGLIWSLATMFYSYCVVEKEGVGPMEAIQNSMKLTKGVRFQLFLFGLMLVALNFAGVLLLFVGVFVTIPVSGLATAYVYKMLRDQTSGGMSSPATHVATAA